VVALYLATRPLEHLARSTRCEREEVAEWSWMFECHGTFSGQPVHGGKDLGPGIAGQQGSEFTSEQVPAGASCWWMADSIK